MRMKMKTLEVNVFGVVQGVGFRWFAQQAAQKNNIVGWVRNRKDGSVTIQAQGTEENMANFLTTIKKGPGFYSRVDDVEIESIAPFESNVFAIRY